MRNTNLTGKKILSLLVSMILTLTLFAACASSEPKPASSEAPSSAASEASTSQPSESQSSQQASQPDKSAENTPKISFITQEYIDDNIAEIPCIEYDGDAIPDIDAINRSLNQGIQQQYDDFMAAYTGEMEWIEIKSYPFTSAKYLQVVVTSIVYPTYGTDGDLLSVNYDIENGKWITADDALALGGLTSDELLRNVGELFVPEFDTQSIDEVKLAGFLLHEGANGPTVEFLLEITVGNSESDPWKSFYSYFPKDADLFQLNGICLFDPFNMDETDPPLTYAQYYDAQG